MTVFRTFFGVNLLRAQFDFIGEIGASEIYTSWEPQFKATCKPFFLSFFYSLI